MGLTGVLALTACTSAGGSSSKDTLSVVAFSVMESANEGVYEAFQDTDAGEDIEFAPSYGASGDQSRAVVDGKDADYVHFSLETDVTRLVDEGLVAEDWKEATPTNGIATSSVVVFVVRKGNPLGIESWDDLAKPDVEIVTPNPGSSGAARWNILAAWAHIVGNGGTEEEAKQFVSDLLANTPALPASGREATSAFVEGDQDVLLSYENEAILAKQNGEDIDYIVPHGHAAHREPGRGDRRREGRGAGLPRLRASRPRRRRCTPASASARSPASTASSSPRSRVRTTRPTRSRLRRSCSPSTVTSVAGPRRPGSSSPTARTASRWASSRSSSRTPARTPRSKDTCGNRNP